MPSHDTVQAFIADVLSNDHVSATKRWYAEDATIQENQTELKVGRAKLVEGEKRIQAASKSIRSELLGPPLINGDHVALRWRFSFEFHDGRKMSIEEVAWQTWREDKISHEVFFYDPKQREPR